MLRTLVSQPHLALPELLSNVFGAGHKLPESLSPSHFTEVSPSPPSNSGSASGSGTGSNSFSAGTFSSTSTGYEAPTDQTLAELYTEMLKSQPLAFNI